VVKNRSHNLETS